MIKKIRKKIGSNDYSKNLSRSFLYVYVFVVGLVVLAIELTASRLIAPFYGSSIFTWGVILGVVLASLAVGYYQGGKLADRGSALKSLGQATLTAGLLICLTALFGRYFLQLSQVVLTDIPFQIFIAPLIAITILFSVPLALLGAVSPLAIKIGSKNIKEIGSVSGSLSASTTLGSIVGSFIAAFVAIPFLGTRITIFTSGVLLMLLSVTVLKKRTILVTLILFLIIIFLILPSSLNRQEVIYETESPYQFITVVQGEDRRFLITENGRGVQSASLDQDMLTGNYIDYLATLPFLLSKKDNLDILIIGAGGGSLAKQYRSFLPDQFTNVNIDLVDIDPKIFQVAFDYFDLLPTDAQIFVVDGREFLRQSQKKYDLVVIDVYQNETYIPFHFLTTEFFSLVNKKLENQGVLAINVIGKKDPNNLFLSSVEKTLFSIFEEVEIIEIMESSNFLFISSQSLLDWQDTSQVPEPFKLKADLVINNSFKLSDSGFVLADDKAPVEYLMWLTHFRSKLQ